MTSIEFIQRIQKVVYESSIEGCLSLLEEPPGRRPSASVVGLSQWFNQLLAADRDNVRASIQLAARAAVFAMLTVLDGVTSIREVGEEVGFFELRYITGAECVLLNDPASEPLHDLFAEEVPPA